MSKLYKLNLTSYKVPGQTVDNVAEEIDYPLAENYATWLMTPGIADDGEDFVVAYVLADNLGKNTSDEYLLNEREIVVLKNAINKLLEATQRGQAALGGKLHAEAIMRVFNIQEHEPKED